MKTLKIEVPDVAHIIVVGPTQCGKSIILDKIGKLLEEFGATVISADLDSERRLNNFDTIDKWEKDMVRNTAWVLKEVGTD